MLVLKELILTVSTLGGCGGLERTHFQQFLHWEELIVNSFLHCGGLERTLQSFYIVTGPERAYFNSFYIWRVW